MNISHLRYVVCIAEMGSINKAAEELHVAQPNLSRVIKEMETDLGIRFFRRSSRGMRLTADGESFVNQARNILGQIDELENRYKSMGGKKQCFSISVPRASYISDAFAVFSRSLDNMEADIFYHESNNTLQTVKDVLEGSYNLGIIRYDASYDKYFKQVLEKKGLSYELVSEFCPVLVMREDSALAGRDVICYSDLTHFIQIAPADSYVPPLFLSSEKEKEYPAVSRHIYVSERGIQFDLLTQNPETFMWASPLPERVVKNLHLVQRECIDSRLQYRDMLIHPADYQLTILDKRFITDLTSSRRNCIK